jgi:hypothetical protein
MNSWKLVVVLGRLPWSEPEDHLVDLAIEAKRHLVVLVVHRRAYLPQCQRSRRPPSGRRLRSIHLMLVSVSLQ